jgi:protein gp37
VICTARITFGSAPSVENAKYLWRIGELIETPAIVHFLSIEPLLGPIPNLPLTDIEWVIVGGESGGCGGARRPMRPEWVREIRDQVIAAHVPLFFKQWGGLYAWSGGRELDDREWNQFPRTPVS